MPINRTFLLNAAQTVPKWCTRERTGAADGVFLGLNGGLARGGGSPRAVTNCAFLSPHPTLSRRERVLKVSLSRRERRFRKTTMTVGSIVILPSQAHSEVRRSPKSARRQAHVRSEGPSAEPGSRAGSSRNGAERHGRNTSNR
jgi:hypothetical protein